MSFPQKIVCLTEESVEFLYDLGREDLIAGVSSFVRRPPQARKKPTLSAFTHANIKKILGSSPDLVIGFSDIQKDIARELIGEGLNVFISNHRSLSETLDYLEMLARMVGEEKKGKELVAQYRQQWDKFHQKSLTRSRRPKVYMEEWDDPMIRGIEWFREVVTICGGEDIFAEDAAGAMARDRFVSWESVCQGNPDIILASWCGKPVNIESFEKRSGGEKLAAVQSGDIYELPPEVILQPGPALFKDGLKMVDDIFTKWENEGGR